MKALVVVLVLVLQTQPLLGAALCAWSDRATQHECDEPIPAAEFLGAAEAVGEGCYGAIPCAPTTPAVPAAASLTPADDPVDGSAASNTLALVTETSSPPAPPPRH